MIGCERLCGRCEGCRRLDWSLRWVIETEDVERIKVAPDIHAEDEQPLLRAVLNPSSLADLLARALRGRGVTSAVVVSVGASVHVHRVVYPSIEQVPDERQRRLLGSPRIEVFALPLARAALSRLLALPLDCGLEVAIAAMEES